MTTTSSTTASTSSTATTTTTKTTNASIGQSILSATNANGAGIDTDSLITSLTAAQKSAAETPITTKQATNTAQLSSAATLASDISTFSQIMDTLVSGGTLQTQPTSSSTGVMTVAPVSGTLAGALSSTVTVTAIAAAQTSQSSTYGTDASFKAGTITLTPASGTAVTVNISANSSLTDIAKAISAQGNGYTASVVDNSLVIKGSTGVANAFTISAQATGDDASAATSSLAALYAGTDNPTQGFTTQQSAADAALTVDGVKVTRSSNSFSDVIAGVQMNLTGVGTTSIGSTRPTAAITQAITDLVANYNSILTDINTATAAATSSSDAGPLRGNATIRQLKAQLSKITTTPLNASGTIRTLAELGVKTGLDGTLSLDSKTLSSMLSKYPDDVEAMFTTSQTSSSSKVTITSTAGATASGTYTVTGIKDTGSNGGTAAGSIGGVAMTGSSWNLTASSGLQLRILSGAPDTATVTINQGLGGLLAALKTNLTGTSGAITTLQTSLAKQTQTLADALTKAEAQVTVYHDRLVTQFTQMNTLVSGYKATQSYLTQQVDLWTKSTS